MRKKETKPRNISQTTKITHSKKDHHTKNSMDAVKKNPDDEYYTPMSAIINELSYWGSLDKFRGKNIICPCDLVVSDGFNSISFCNNGTTIFNAIKRKPLPVVDLFNLTDTINPTLYSVSTDAKNGFGYLGSFVQVLTDNMNAWGIQSITVSGYNPTTENGIPFQEVDFSQYDICVTNPPFSLYSEFMKCLVDNIDFIIISPMLNRVATSIGLYLMTGKAYLGKSADNYGGFIAIPFSVHGSTTETKNIACDWVTSFNEAQIERNKRLSNEPTNHFYQENREQYLTMPNIVMKDDTNPIRVPSKDFPKDYDGWMFASVNILAYISWDEYEWYGTHFMRYFNNPNNTSPFKGFISNRMLRVDDREMFHGIVFRRKIHDKNF